MRARREVQLLGRLGAGLSVIMAVLCFLPWHEVSGRYTCTGATHHPVLIVLPMFLLFLQLPLAFSVGRVAAIVLGAIAVSVWIAAPSVIMESELEHLFSPTRPHMTMALYFSASLALGVAAVLEIVYGARSKLRHSGRMGGTGGGSPPPV
jgi:hypothetical protein